MGKALKKTPFEQAVLSVLNILDNFCQGLRQLVPVHQMQVLDWRVMQRGRCEKRLF
jgi:hypothetical protein